METSAKNGINAKKIFIDAAKILLKDYNRYRQLDEDEDNNEQIVIGLEQEKKGIQEKKNCGC